MERMIAIVAVAAVMLAMDLCWITSQKPMYGALVRSVQGKPMTVHIFPALVSYALVVLAFVGLVVPNVHASTTGAQAIRQGAIVGFVVYGVYNATNAAIFDDYNVKTGVLDTLWGTFLFAVSSVLFLYLRYRVKF